jgi:hypothetical protein
LTVMISAANPPLSPTCSTGPHERSEPAHHLRASLVNIVATEPALMLALSFTLGIDLPRHDPGLLREGLGSPVQRD